MAYRNILPLLAILLLGFGAGWWLGSRKTEEVVREEVRYVQRPMTEISIELPTPTKVEIVKFPRIQYTDTITIAERIPTDTAGIINDYLQRRTYDLDFSTDTTGIFKVQAVVEANRLASASAHIIPLQREVEKTVVKVRPFRPYIGGGIAISKSIGASVEVGALLKEHHLPRVGYQRLGNGNYITLNYGYIF